MLKRIVVHLTLNLQIGGILTPDAGWNVIDLKSTLRSIEAHSEQTSAVRVLHVLMWYW